MTRNSSSLRTLLLQIRHKSDRRGALNGALKRAGLSHMTQHDMRHIFAMHIIKTKGLKVAQALLGHKLIQTTMQYDSTTEDWAINEAKNAPQIDGA